MGGSKKRKAAKKKKASEPYNLGIVQQHQKNNENDEVKERDSDGGEKEVVSPATDAEGNQQLGRELERRDNELPHVDHSNAPETTTGTGTGTGIGEEGDGLVDIEEIVVVECSSEAVEKSNRDDDDYKCVVLDAAAADSLVSSGEMNDAAENSLESVAAAVSETEYVVEDTKTMLHTSSKLEQAASPALDLVENTPETFHKQRLAGAPVHRLVMDQKSSWLGCCGMFDLLRGGR